MLTQLTTGQLIMAGWLGSTGLIAFMLFGYDKWQARRNAPRVAEATLWLVSAFGGWPGGFLGMLCFRHKTEKLWFIVEFTAALLVWFTLVSGVWTALASV